MRVSSSRTWAGLRRSGRAAPSGSRSRTVASRAARAAAAADVSVGRAPIRSVSSPVGRRAVDRQAGRLELDGQQLGSRLRPGGEDGDGRVRRGAALPAGAAASGPSVGKRGELLAVGGRHLESGGSPGGGGRRCRRAGLGPPGAQVAIGSHRVPGVGRVLGSGVPPGVVVDGATEEVELPAARSVPRRPPAVDRPQDTGIGLEPAVHQPVRRRDVPGGRRPHPGSDQLTSRFARAAGCPPHQPDPEVACQPGRHLGDLRGAPPTGAVRGEPGPATRCGRQPHQRTRCHCRGPEVRDRVGGLDRGRHGPILSCRADTPATRPDTPRTRRHARHATRRAPRDTPGVGA